MNPLAWSTAHKLALAIWVLLGAAFGPLIGYIVAEAPVGSEGGISFGYWLQFAPIGNGLVWAGFGTACFALAYYAHRISN